MRLPRILVLGMLVPLWFPAAGSSGVYNPDLSDPNTKAPAAEVAEETMGPTLSDKGVSPLPFKPFRIAQDAQMEIPDPIRNTARRQRYLARAEELRKKVEADPDNVSDRISLGAYYIRLAQFDQAIQLLEGAARGLGRNNFMVLTNLATAYQMLGDLPSLQRADDYLSLALGKSAVWPAAWSKEQLAWYREAEEMQLKLIRARRKELMAHGGKSQPIEAVDDLFGVQFVGDDGTYQAGTLAAEQKKKLPKNSRAIVQQLILWFPGDSRLYWLLGELLNAEGDIANAKTVFDQCAESGRRINAVTLRQHRQVLEDALAAAKPVPSEPRSWLPDRNKLIMVGGGVGIVVLFLAYFQVREIRRRKQTPE
jgi:tetratricopeptide (TPR) repeat protein